MTVEQILQVLETRRKIAEEEGNPTELSLLFEITKMAEDYKVIQDMMRKN